MKEGISSKWLDGWMDGFFFGAEPYVLCRMLLHTWKKLF